MDLKDIYQLWDRMETSSVSELELEMHGIRLVLKKGCEKNGTPVLPVTKMQEQMIEQPADEPVAEIAKKAVKNQMNQTNNAVQVKAPLVGTFYQASAPGEAPFVTVGQKVNMGDVVGIIEAMKLMNEITAPKDGIVTAVLVEDGDMVEYNQVLIEIE